jgi:hypothetical protein
MLIYERISAVVSAALIGLALYFVLNFPSQTAATTLFGSPLVLESPRRWLMVVLLAGLTMAGMDAVVRIQPNLPSQRLDYLATFWMLPGLLVVLATQTLGLAPSAVAWAVALLVVGGLLWLTIVAEAKQAAPGRSSRFWPRLWQQFIGYAMTLIFFIVIYQTRNRSAVSATAILAVSGMVALALLRQSPNQISKTWLFAAVVGLSLGQITWALNYWRTGALNAGLLLFLIFYILVGLAQQHLQGALSRRTLWEFGAIAAVGLLVIFNL